MLQREIPLRPELRRASSLSMGNDTTRQFGSFHRPFFLLLFSTLLLGTHVVRLAQLQLVDGQKNREQANNNRMRIVPIPSNRGQILDRKGRAIASNHLTRAVYLWPKEHIPEDWKVIVPKLSKILKVPESEIFSKLQQAGYQSFRPIPIAKSINSEVFVSIGELVSEYRGIELRTESNRHYPQGNRAAHVVGYIGEASAEDMKKHPEYPMGIIVGHAGIEATSNKQLIGTWGQRKIIVNSKSQELGELGQTLPISGENVKLTLDLDLQKTAEDALGDRKGGVAVIDVKTGEVLALASRPTFDPNIFTRRVTEKEWETLQGQENPFLNRALQGYPPGSTFKIVTSAAGIESGTYSPDSIIGTSNYITIGGIQFNEHSGGYGWIGFREALTYSSNTFFYQVGMGAGPEQIGKWANLLGLGKTIDLKLLGLTGGSHGFIPTAEDKNRLFNEPWYAGDTVTMSIGQGLVLATPLEAAVMTATIANGGNRVKPHLLASQTNTALTKPVSTGMKPETVRVIQDGLIGVVQSGTAAQVLNDGSIPLTAGKTGTSEVQGQESHSWYVAYGPANKPEIAIAVVVENGGFGAKAAAPVAREIFRTYFSLKSAVPSK